MGWIQDPTPQLSNTSVDGTGGVIPVVERMRHGSLANGMDSGAMMSILNSVSVSTRQIINVTISIYNNVQNFLALYNHHQLYLEKELRETMVLK